MTQLTVPYELSPMAAEMLFLAVNEKDSGVETLGATLHEPLDKALFICVR